MLAKRLPTILPDMSLEEALETTKIHSVMGLLGNNRGIISQRPFRSPHHTTSDVAIVGGGSVPKPGEVTLSHNGILFLDELPEFNRNVLESLRQPLEDYHVTISRAIRSVRFPSKFMLICAMNPLPVRHTKQTDRNETRSVIIIHVEKNLNEIYFGYTENPKTFGQYIRKCRLDENLQLKDLADKIGCSDSIFILWEKDRATPSLSFIKKLHKKYEIPRSLLKKAIAKKFNLSKKEKDMLFEKDKILHELEKGKDFGKAMKAYRLSTFETSKAIAVKLGINQSTILDWENGRHTATQKLRNKIIEKIKNLGETKNG